MGSITDPCGAPDTGSAVGYRHVLQWNFDFAAQRKDAAVLNRVSIADGCTRFPAGAPDGTAPRTRTNRPSDGTR